MSKKGIGILLIIIGILGEVKVFTAEIFKLLFAVNEPKMSITRNTPTKDFIKMSKF